MASLYRRRGSIFSGLLLITIGVLFLLQNYRGLEIGSVLAHWWPLILIFWGAIKLYERAGGGAQAPDGSGRRGTGGEALLVVGLVALVAIVALAHKIPGSGIDVNFGGDSHEYDLDVAPKTVPLNARITIHNGHGDISVRAGDSDEIRVSGKKSIQAWSESDADRLAKKVNVEIVQNGDAFEIVAPGAEPGSSKIAVDLDVVVPQKSSLTVREERGDVSIVDLATGVSVTSQRGDVEVRGTSGDVNIDMRKGDVKVSDTKGDVKISGKGGEVNVLDASGGLTLDGEFYGPIRAEKVLKGVRFISQRTDLTLTQLTGHLEASSGNLEIADVLGNLTLRTNSYDVSVENATGKVKIDNSDGSVTVRYSAPPKEDVEISNSSSSIDLSLPGSSSFDIVADCRSGDIDSEFSGGGLKQTGGDSGNAHLEGKYGNGRGPKITLKTSYGSLSLHKTTGVEPPGLPKPPKPPKGIPEAEEQ